ncbi:hypothetical protein C2845_PM11G18180 [Panicum miliaceum]|uniref:Uncharacterized protein n=1 Tax=Panicum miliaceum TaxID=4540 RepID=A0A3L6RXN6_PANMI|nr:hypothetical protein C2845_PM11G18180 [Panicum miliaceum]
MQATCGRPPRKKLKKLSSSSSRRSHGTASSRDNMSVDSSHRDTDPQEDATPAVQRSCVQGRIHVLTSVEQLVPWNDYEREALDLLKNQTLPELQYLFAMAKKIKLSPVMSMLAHSQKMIAGRSPIDITTLATRIATHVKALDNA